MLIYVDELLAEIESIKEYALIVQAKFDQGRPANELLLDARALDKRIEYLVSVMPEGCLVGKARQHVQFMIHYLQKDQIDSCLGDITDIVSTDLPSAVEAVKKWANDLAYVDADLRDEIRTLVKTGQFDSVVRKSFVVLKTRLCRKYSIAETVDGAELINKIFGSNSSYFTDIDPKQKQAYRDLFAGLFGLIRNRYSHNNVEFSLAEVDLAISAVNYCLRLVDDFQLSQPNVAEP